MTTRETKLRRLLAGAGALALALGGVVGAASAANAATGYPVPDQPGTLTLHKHVKDDTSPNGQPKGAPLAGVTFTVQGVGTTQAGGACSPIDLATPAGWASVTAAIDGFTTSTPDLPPGYCLIGSPQEVVTGTDGSTPTLSNLKGLFVVKETKPGPNLIAQPAAPFLVTVPMPVAGASGANDSWDYSVDAYPKNVLTTVTPTKTVSGTNKDGSVLPGAIVDWTVSVPVPAAAFPYTQITVTDTPAAGHTFNGFTSLALNGTPLVAGDYSVSGAIVTLTDAGLAKVNAITTGAEAQPATLTVALTTKVTGDTLGELDNNASVTLNGNTVPVTPPSTNWGKLTVLKQDAASKAALAGAAFSVYAKTGASCSPVSGTPVANGTTSSSGEFSQVLWISNTNADQTGPFTKAYCLVETAAPAGYILDTTPREVTLSTEGTAVTTYTFPNTKVNGPSLPLTGGDGTVVLAMGGFGLLAAAAGVVLTTRRRAGSKR